MIIPALKEAPRTPDGQPDFEKIEIVCVNVSRGKPVWGRPVLDAVVYGKVEGEPLTIQQAVHVEEDDLHTFFFGSPGDSFTDQTHRVAIWMQYDQLCRNHHGDPDAHLDADA